MVVDDGKCVVDVVLKGDAVSDYASPFEIREAAERVMQHCVDAPKEPSEGGDIGFIGEFQR